MVNPFQIMCRKKGQVSAQYSRPSVGLSYCVEPDPSAERAQDSEGRIDNGMEHVYCDVNIYKGDSSETQTSSSILNKSKAYIQF